MKINTKVTIKDLAGKDIPAGDKFFTVGTAISNILLDAKEGGKMKLFTLAQEFYKEKEFDIDAVDIDVVSKAVESTEQYNNLVTGQILAFLDETKSTDKKNSA